MIWNVRDKQIEYGKKVLIMGILNITPDSFSDGGCNFSAENALESAKRMIDEGVDIIDIGAQSTRPGYKEISPDEEWERLKEPLTLIRKITDKPISVDTYFPKAAKLSLESGADIINDVSGKLSLEMANTVKSFQCGYILVHSEKGKSDDVRRFFISFLDECEKLDIDKSRICLDMGIGFNKDYDDNMELIANVKKYKIDGCPLLFAASRKRVIGESSEESTAKNRIFGNIAADTAAILGGADIIRVHDVKNERHGILTAQKLRDYVR